MVFVGAFSLLDGAGAGPPVVSSTGIGSGCTPPLSAGVVDGFVGLGASLTSPHILSPIGINISPAAPATGVKFYSFKAPMPVRPRYMPLFGLSKLNLLANMT